jgi:hypothetical protein
MLAFQACRIFIGGFSSFCLFNLEQTRDASMQQGLLGLQQRKNNKISRDASNNRDASNGRDHYNSWDPRKATGSNYTSAKAESVATA